MPKKQALISVDTTIEVPFHDVDSAHIAWHGHYVKYFEIGRCKLLDAIDYNYMQMGESGYFWPVIDLHVRYVNPARFQQHISVKTSLIEWEHRLKLDYLITDPQSGARLTKGHTVQVAVGISSGEMQLASPDIVREKLAERGLL